MRTGSRRIHLDDTGTFSCPECGCILDDVRSLPHHRAFFAYVRDAFRSWPAGREPNPVSPEHLRSWLEIEAGHAMIRPYHFSTRAMAAAAAEFAKAEMAADRLEGRYSILRELPDAKGFEIVRPTSIKWEKVGQAKFNELSNKVSDIVKEVIGISFDEWKEKRPA